MSLAHTTSTSPLATVRYTCGPSSLGLVLLAYSEHGVCALLLGEDQATLEADLSQRLSGLPRPVRDDRLHPQLARAVQHLEHPDRPFDVPLDLAGSAFQRRVWQALRQIPAGETASYSEIARRLGQPNAFRAVARACAANPLAVIVPCHRVVRLDGGLSGYRWGVERKRALLEREARR